MNSENIFFLKHLDDIVGIISIDEVQGSIISYKEVNPELSPYLGNADLSKIKKWWQSRAIPGTRYMLDKILRDSECNTNYDYLAKNLGLSLTDCYWICPVNSDLKWEKVCLYNGLGSENLIPYHNSTSYDPNASLGGQMEKYWDMSGNEPRLIKTATGYYGQQAANEEFATVLHSMQNTNFLFTRYYTQRRELDDALQSVCPAFTSKVVEFIPALEVVDSISKNNDVSMYNHFAMVCERHGLDREYIRKFLDYQTMTDFLISNCDEHLLNFGILRAAYTLDFVSEAPIFDSGNSMFYLDSKTKPLSRVEMLSKTITATHDTEEKMLKSVLYKSVIDMNALPSKKDVKEFYVLRGLPEDKADILSINYDLKATMLDEFIRGISISLYNEKKRSTGRK